MPVKKWDVVFVSVPNQEDKSKSTKRPAIILKVIDNNHVAICPITKQIIQAKNYSKTIYIAKDSDDNRFLKLRFNSLIVIDRIDAINISCIDFVFGRCSPSIISKIEELLK